MTLEEGFFEIIGTHLNTLEEAGYINFSIYYKLEDWIQYSVQKYYVILNWLNLLEQSIKKYFKPVTYGFTIQKYKWKLD